MCARVCVCVSSTRVRAVVFGFSLVRCAYNWTEKLKFFASRWTELVVTVNGRLDVVRYRAEFFRRRLLKYVIPHLVNVEVFVVRETHETIPALVRTVHNRRI